MMSKSCDKVKKYIYLNNDACLKLHYLVYFMQRHAVRSLSIGNSSTVFYVAI